jgi:hypothetical protein
MEIDGSRLWLGLKHRLHQYAVRQPLEGDDKSGRICQGLEQLNFSSRNFDFLYLKELMESIPDVREERITEVRGDLKCGTYNVIAERIADKIIRGDVLTSIL